MTLFTPSRIRQIRAAHGLTLGLVFLLLAGLVGDLFHNLVVPHHWCEVHGEWTHVEENDHTALLVHTEGIHENRVGSPEHQHADCDLSVTRSRFALTASAEFGLISYDTVRSATPFAFSAPFSAPFALYELAPKNSPPRV